jgi:lysophospholipase L1-like esterase
MRITPLTFVVFSFFILLAVFIKLESKPTKTYELLNPESLVLAFGDSLTYGKGAPTQSYPVQLQGLIGMKVINEGISGETSARGLNRLPSLLQKYHPSLLILCHGGNDLIQKKSKELLKKNLRKMIQISKASGTKVLLIGIPNFKMIRFSTEPLYEELALQEQVLYEGGVLATIENNSELKSDRIHPNAKGYALMAKTFAQVLKDNGLVRE